MTTCFMCGIEIKAGDQRHIYFCSKKQNSFSSKEDLRYRQICHGAGFIFSKELLVSLYINQQYSLTDFKLKYGLAFRQTQFLLNYFNINSRTHADGIMTDRSRTKKLKTNREKYGVDNVSQNLNIKNKKAATFTERYGVDNIRKSPLFRQKLNATMLKKYGKRSVPNLYGNAIFFGHDNLSEEEKARRIKKGSEGKRLWYKNLSDEQKAEYARVRTRHFVIRWQSSLEIRLAKILDETNIAYMQQFWLKNKSFDFYIKKTKTIIEVQGDFWHANPNIYMADDNLKFPNGTVKAFDLWEKDSIKNQLARKYGYKVVYIWESEIRSMSNIELALWVKGISNET